MKENTVEHKIKVTIITRAYNVEKYIEDCIKSVINQKFADFEWIVLENGSTDRTGDILKEYAERDNRIRLYFNKKNYNSIVQNEEGYYTYLDLLAFARGKYIADLDSDDILHVEFLKKLYGKSKDGEVDIIAAGSVQFLNDDIKRIGRIVVPKQFESEDISELGDDIRDFYNAFRPVWGKLIKRELYIENMKYIYERPAYISQGGDTYTCLRLLQIAKSCVCIEEPLYYYRVRANSVSMSYYYKERYLCYDEIFFQTLLLLKMWKKDNEKNLKCLCAIHLGGLQIELNMIGNIQGISLSERLRFIENLLSDKVYLEYITILVDEDRKNWENMVDSVLDKIYRDAQKNGEDIQFFYQYNYARRFITKRHIVDKCSDEQDIVLCVVSHISHANTFRNGNDLLNLCVKCMTGKECGSLEEAREYISAFLGTEDYEYDKKVQLNNAISGEDYSLVEKMLQSFDDSMQLDCDILFAKACCSYAQGKTKTAVRWLAIANELYPEEKIIKENLDGILEQSNI
ncbi:MAG: glycosyltransferase family 2 protein [Clostridiales bacterium]|mgnify:CR=1 FL=1|nr:glycosyltransferase family 2 protein [Clostridiales bacterium]